MNGELEEWIDQRWKDLQKIDELRQSEELLMHQLRRAQEERADVTAREVILRRERDQLRTRLEQTQSRHSKRLGHACAQIDETRVELTAARLALVKEQTVNEALHARLERLEELEEQTRQAHAFNALNEGVSRLVDSTRLDKAMLDEHWSEINEVFNDGNLSKERWLNDFHTRRLIRNNWAHAMDLCQ